MDVINWLPVISAVGLFYARVKEVGTKRDTIAGPVKENLTLRLFVLTGVISLVGSLLEYYFLRGFQISWIPFALGWVIGIASFFIRRRAIAALGRFWSLHVEIRENHEFVKSGPFTWVRHPTYFSMILELLAFSLILSAFITLLVIPLLFIPALFLRLRLEEAALVEKFGEAYKEYQKNTPMLIPYKWPAKN